MSPEIKRYPSGRIWVKDNTKDGFFKAESHVEGAGQVRAAAVALRIKPEEVQARLDRGETVKYRYFEAFVGWRLTKL